jgi:hypothetical protein
MLAAPDKPSLTASPTYSFPPSNIILLLRNIPEQSKEVCLILDSETAEYRSDCHEWQGERSMRTEFKGVGQGDYIAGASIDGKIVATAKVVVVGGEP